MNPRQAWSAVVVGEAGFIADSGSGYSSSAQPSVLTCQQSEYVSDKLPVDILHHIQSLLPLKDAARTACISRGYLHAWRCYSNLALDAKTLGLARIEFDYRETFLIHIVDNILSKHSGHGLEIFRLDFRFSKNVYASYLDRWLKIVFHSGIKELSLMMPSLKKKGYIFPCWVLSDEVAASSVQFLDLHACAFRTTTALGCLRSLRKLHLSFVNITDDGLGHLLSKSSALEEMDIFNCSKIICLRLPCTLQQLKFLKVTLCESLQAVDINAPKLSTFHFIGMLVEFPTADPSPLKNVTLASFAPPRTLSFARARLPDIARNVISLTLRSVGENVNTPMLISKFPCLTKLEIDIQRSQRAFLSFDVMSLVSFLDASPTLDSFILHVGQEALRQDDLVGGGGDSANYQRWKPQCRHDHLRQVMITGFCSDKNMIQFVIYILENSPSLKCLTLDTIPGIDRSCGIIGKMERCSRMSENSIAEAHRAVTFANGYIKERVPLGVRFQVLEPCIRCHIRRRC
uniref:Uncharacterized protein n=1 Tax=Avena sativa TaxID=4498 RepID=A0ACD5WL02_AVESA